MFSYNLYAYCSNNPVNYDDPSGESWLAAAVGAIVNVATTFIAAVITDQEYTIADAGAAALAGAASAFGFAGAVGGGVLTGVATFLSSIHSGYSVGESLAMGTVSTMFSTFAISTMVAGDELETGISAMVGLTFGFGSNLLGAASVSGIKNRIAKRPIN